MSTSKNYITQLNEYCQKKNSKITQSDLNFTFDTNIIGYFKCKVIIKNKIYDNKKYYKSKREAKNSISEYVYNCIVEEDNKKSSSKNITNDKYDKYDKKR